MPTKITIPETHNMYCEIEGCKNLGNLYYAPFPIKGHNSGGIFLCDYCATLLGFCCWCGLHLEGDASLGNSHVLSGKLICRKCLLLDDNPPKKQV